MWLLIVTLVPNTTALGVLAGHVAALCFYPFLFIRTKLKIPQKLKPLLIVTTAFFVAIVLSITVSANRAAIGFGIIRYAFVPFYWLFGLYAGITEVRLFKDSRTTLLFNIAAIFIIVQLPVVILQFMGADGLLSTLWSTEKVSTVTSRVVGTVANPSRLGILCILAIIIFIQNLKQKRLWSVVLITISVLIIIATGSRTSLVLLLLLPFLHLGKRKFFSKYSIYILLLGIAVLALSYYLLLHYQNLLPYMSEILELISSGKVSSLQHRFIHWSNAIDIYGSSSYLRKMFGLGAGYFTVMDNSYLYVLINYGIVGFITFVGLLIFVFITINSQDNRIALYLLFVCLIGGLVQEILISFLFMTFIYYLIGFKAEMQNIHSNALSKASSVVYS